MSSADSPLSREIRLQGIFRRLFRDPGLVIRREFTAWDVPGWDSLRNVQLMMEVELEFKIRLTVAEVLKLGSVGDLLDLINRKLESSPL